MQTPRIFVVGGPLADPITGGQPSGSLAVTGDPIGIIESGNGGSRGATDLSQIFPPPNIRFGDKIFNFTTLTMPGENEEKSQISVLPFLLIGILALGAYLVLK